MLRKILGYAVLAVVAFFVLRLALWVIRVTLGLAWTVLMLALVGLVVYWVIKLISPSTARRVKDVISGEHRSEGDL
jgi:FtsH-binding integral membrane protein